LAAAAMPIRMEKPLTCFSSCYSTTTAKDETEKNFYNKNFTLHGAAENGKEWRDSFRSFLFLVFNPLQQQ